MDFSGWRERPIYENDSSIIQYRCKEKYISHNICYSPFMPKSKPIVHWLSTPYIISKYNSNDVLRTIAKILIENEIFHKFSMDYLFDNISVYLKNNKKLMILAIKMYSYIFSYASDKLKHDEEFIIAALKNDHENIYYVPQDMLFNKKIAITLFQTQIGKTTIYQTDLNLFPPIIQSDKEVAHYAVKANSRNFKFVSNELKDDKEISLIAITQQPHMFELVSSRLVSDKDFICTAVELNTRNLEFVSNKFKTDYEVIIASVPKNKHLYYRWDNKNKFEKELFCDYLKQQAKAYKSIKYFLLFMKRISKNNVLYQLSNYDINFENSIAKYLGITVDITTPRYYISDKSDGAFWLSFKNAYDYCHYFKYF